MIRIFSKLDTEDCEVLVSENGTKCDGESVCNCKENFCLAGGDCNSGDVFIKGEPLSDLDWNFTDADVLCRQIGFSGAKKHTTKRR